MNCKDVLEMAYEDNYGIFGHVQIWTHTLFCAECAQKIELYKLSRMTMRNDFFPLSTNGMETENSIMSCLTDEKQEDSANTTYGIFSTRGWIITGLIILLSFAAAFFGLDFRNVSSEIGMSFVLPVGIIFGIVLTCYCAIFIGSHLKEFSERFGL